MSLLNRSANDGVEYVDPIPTTTTVDTTIVHTLESAISLDLPLKGSAFEEPKMDVSNSKSTDGRLGLVAWLWIFYTSSFIAIYLRSSRKSFDNILICFIR